LLFYELRDIKFATPKIKEKVQVPALVMAVDTALNVTIADAVTKSVMLYLSD
jgi:hypothetical protein